MGIELTAEVLDGPDSLGEVDVIAFPVAEHHGAVRVPLGLPASIAGVEIPVQLEGPFTERHRFTGATGQTLIIRQSPDAPTLLAVGIGDPTVPDAEAWRQAGAAVVHAVKGRRAAFLLTLPSTVRESVLAEAVVTGALLASYRYDLKSTAHPASLDALLLVPFAADGVGAQALEALAEGAAHGRAVAGAVDMARDLVNRVPSELTPKRLAASALRRLEKSDGVTAEVWREQRLETERLGGLLGVAKGSSEPARLVVATYEPSGASQDAADDDLEHVVLVGKGITFDSGGLSLKTATGMVTMKTDMSGAAIVLAAVTACAALDIKVRVTAIAPMAENMPSGTAMKPGDVLTARDGTTIEVLNTDAEGRLILADALVLAAERTPDVIIDVATLTGAAVTALGRSVGALFSNRDGLAESMRAAGEASGEPLWRLPLIESYRRQLDSEVADLKNIGSAGEAGSVVAGLFLEHFVGETAWAHLDIAGPARAEKTKGYVSQGGTAFGLRAILSYLRTLG